MQAGEEDRNTLGFGFRLFLCPTDPKPMLKTRSSKTPAFRPQRPRAGTLLTQLAEVSGPAVLSPLGRLGLPVAVFSVVCQLKIAGVRKTNRKLNPRRRSRTPNSGRGRTWRKRDGERSRG